MPHPIKAVLAFFELGDEVAVKKILAADPNIKVYPFDPKGVDWDFYYNVPISDIVELVKGRKWTGLLIVFSAFESALSFLTALNTLQLDSASMLFPTNSDAAVLNYRSFLDPEVKLDDDTVSSVFNQNFEALDLEEVDQIYTTAIVAYFNEKDYPDIKEAALKKHPDVVLIDFDPSGPDIDNTTLTPIADETVLLGIGIPDYAGTLVLAKSMDWVGAITAGNYCMLFPTTDVDRMWELLEVAAPAKLHTEHQLTETGIRHVSGTSDSPAW